MKCLKCQENIKGPKPKLKLNPLLAHLKNWGVCDNCDNTGEYASKYYRNNKQHYRELHMQYKEELSDSYVANCLADKRSIKATDVPNEIIESKRQYMKLKRILKENDNVKKESR